MAGPGDKRPGAGHDGWALESPAPAAVISSRSLKVVPGEREGVMATSIKLDDALKDRVQRLAGLRRRSAHWIMREAITQ